jgi:hypothetical protein
VYFSSKNKTTTDTGTVKKGFTHYVITYVD